MARHERARRRHGLRGLCSARRRSDLVGLRAPGTVDRPRRAAAIRLVDQSITFEASVHPGARRRPVAGVHVRAHAHQRLTARARCLDHFRAEPRDACLLPGCRRPRLRATSRPGAAVSPALPIEVGNRRRHERGPREGAWTILVRRVDSISRERSKHPELASARLILLGFSGTGSSSDGSPRSRRSRILAVISAQPRTLRAIRGEHDHRCRRMRLAIPHFILAGSADAVSGTERPYAYFRRHFERGACVDASTRAEPGAALLHA